MVKKMKSYKKLKEEMKAELDNLIEWSGSQARLAQILDVTRQAVSVWVARGRISASMAIEVEKATKGAFTKRQLRPDVVKWIDEE